MVRRSSSAWLECQPVTLEVEGSSPFCVAINFRPNTFKVFGLTLAQIAQSVEQGTENPRVGSSILSLSTKSFLKLFLLFQHSKERVFAYRENIDDDQEKTDTCIIHVTVLISGSSLSGRCY